MHWALESVGLLAAGALTSNLVIGSVVYAAWVPKVRCLLLPTACEKVDAVNVTQGVALAAGLDDWLVEVTVRSVAQRAARCSRAAAT